MGLPYLKRKTRQMADLSRKITVDLSNERVGIVSTIPVSTLDIGIDVDSTGLTGNLTGIARTASSLNSSAIHTFTGKMTASKFVGFGSALTGVGYTTVAVIFDRKASSEDGGTFTSGAWRTRDLNHIESDPDNIVSISNNQFTLQPGTYNIEWMAQTSNVKQHRSRLYNATDSVAVTFGDGTDTSEGGVCCNKYGHSWNTITGYSRSRGSVAKLTITSAKAFEIGHICDTTRADNGFGLKTNDSAYDSYNYYTMVVIYKGG